MPPSTSPTPSIPLKLLFVGALPKSTSPAQSPRTEVEASEVNTIGFATVPSAFILLLRVMIKPPLRPFSPTIFVPGSMVRIAPLVTYTSPRSLYVNSAFNVRLAVIRPSRIVFSTPGVTTTPPPLPVPSTSIFLQPTFTIAVMVRA